MKQFYILYIILLFSSFSYSQIITFPDTNFKNALLSATATNNVAQDDESNSMVIDANSNGEIEISEAMAVYELNVSSNTISDLSGIENFTNLIFLNCGLNQITTLDVTSLFNLQTLRCTNNGMSNLSVNGLSNLLNIEAFSNQLTTLDVTGLSALTDLKLSNNQISALDVSGLSNLEYLVTSYMDLETITFGSHPNMTNLELVNTNITEVDLSGCTGLESIICYGSQLTNLVLDNLQNLGIVNATDNQIETVSLTNTPGLWNLMVSNNNLTFLDASGCTGLTSLSCNNNQMEAIIIKNGIVEQLYFGENPNLQYICCDSEQIDTINAQVIQLGLNTNVNSYCTLTPGGEYYNIDGVATFDFNNDGCDPTETPVPYLQYNYTTEGVTGSFFGTAGGDYLLYPQTGITIIEPVLENPDYYTISPTEVTINFPTDSNPYMQDFCVTANGVHPDLEMTMIPITAARPGFDAEYQIIYSNKGNQLLSGDVTLTYANTLMTFVEAIPNFDAETMNTMTWNFSDLEPFESRTIYFTFSINAPTDTPPVEIDDTLIFSTVINPVTGDENPEDNEFELAQTVFGSFDPNDITCLKGKSIAPETVGEYVHYLIRFENTGTFAAENIVVRDEIDTQRFNMDSFRPVASSHEFITRINGNIVEFIFEGVNLPFDDDNNDGFVIFKIRTLPTLTLGDTFSNHAEIYFDFNFPIITNTYVTTVENQLSVSEFENSQNIIVYPNPSTDMIHIKTDLEINTYEVVNLLGQSIIGRTALLNDKMIAISNLNAGHYFLKLEANDRTEYLRFVKK